jgi:hypothetical protein
VIVETISRGTRVEAYEISENSAKSAIFVTNDVVCLLPTNMQSAVVGRPTLLLFASVYCCQQARPKLQVQVHRDCQWQVQVHLQLQAEVCQ